MMVAYDAVQFRAQSGEVSSAASSRANETVRLGPPRALPGQRLVGPAIVLLLWIVGSALDLISAQKLPTPGIVTASLFELIKSGELQANLLASLDRVAFGLSVGVLGGLILAIVACLTRLGDALFDGLVHVKRAIPTLALIPLAIIWFGIGEPMKIIIIALAAFIPVYINMHAGLSGIDRRFVELAESLGFTRWRFLRAIVLPGSLPSFFVGLRLAITHAWTALVVVETINATSGIGYMMTQARIYGQTEIVMVGLLVYGALGLSSDSLVRFIERRALSWQQVLVA